MKRNLIPLLLCGALAALAAAPASADIISFDLTTPNPAISGFTGPYEHVEVNRTSATTATITFTSLTNLAGNTFLMGGAGAAGVNVNATSWTISGITGSNSFAGFTPGPFSDGGSGNEDGFGSFNQTIDDFDGYTHSVTSLSFLLTDTSGTWADASSVLTANADGNLAAAHVFVCDNPCLVGNQALATGFASGSSSGGGGASTGGNIPEPATVALLGLGMLGMGISRKPRSS